MSEGIRIDAATLELDEAAVEALIERRAIQVTVQRFDLSLSEPVINRLLARPKAEGQPPWQVELRPGEVVVRGERSGVPVRLTLRIAGLRAEVEAGQVRVRSE